MKKLLKCLFLSIILVTCVCGSANASEKKGHLIFEYIDSETSDFFYPTVYIENTSNDPLHVSYSTSLNQSGEILINAHSMEIVKFTDMKILKNTGKDSNILFSWFQDSSPKPLQYQVFIDPFYGDESDEGAEIPYK